jgi:hypothetical protein
MNLGPPAAKPSSQRPYQPGNASGTKAGAPVRVAVEWMVDTGAEIGTVTKRIGDSFDLVATAASASPTTGGGGILVKTGMVAEFMAEDNAGTQQALSSSSAVGVKSNNSGSEILGVDQLAALAVEVEWDPARRRGTLKISTAAKSLPASAPMQPTATGSKPSLRPPLSIVDHGTWLDVGGVRLEKRQGWRP